MKVTIVYDNMENDKQLTLNEFKHKSGIYRLVNKLNNKSYIGSAKDLKTRFLVYFSKNRLTKSNMSIYKAIIKYGYINFRVKIIEYCEKDILIKREQDYLNMYKPEYNILTKAYSTLNYKHTPATLKKF